MLTDSDREWLAREYPKLAIEDKGLVGTVEFTATYNPTTGRFLRFTEGVVDGVGGDRLSGTFHVRVMEREDKSFARLPALFIDDIKPSLDRHFNGPDSSACLCNYLEEDEFISPFSFQRYFEELVIPFLYGQLYFDQHGRWPWADYAHGGLGTLEAYSKNPTPEKARELLDKVNLDLLFWWKLRPLLVSDPATPFDATCLCAQRDPSWKCHPLALKGLQLLVEVIRKEAIPVPD